MSVRKEIERNGGRYYHRELRLNQKRKYHGLKSWGASRSQGGGGLKERRSLAAIAVSASSRAEAEIPESKPEKKRQKILHRPYRKGGVN